MKFLLQIKKYSYILALLTGLFAGYLIGVDNSPPQLPEKINPLSVSVCDEVMKNRNGKVDEIFSGTPAPVNFASNPEANLFYTTITEQASGGPDFAGHYTVAAWGCGQQCQGYAIIDAISGDIVVYEPYIKHPVSFGMHYELDKNILILNPKFEQVGRSNPLLGRSIEEILKEDQLLDAKKKRIYYQLSENEGGAFLAELCTENMLDGQF